MKKLLSWFAYYNYGIDIIICIMASLIFIFIHPLYFLIEILKVIFAVSYDIADIEYNYVAVWKRIFDL